MAESLLHRHHVVPIHMGGPKDGPTILLTIEQHAEAHRELWETHGLWQDFVAWKCLSGAMNHQDAIKIAISEGGKKASQLHRGMKRSQVSRQRMSEAAVRRGVAHLSDPEMRKAIGRKNVGRKRSTETREKIRDRAIERYQRERENGGIVRARHSLESRRRMSDAKKNIPRDRLVVCEICSREFMAKMKTARLCSAACKTRAYRRRQGVV